MLRFLQMPLGAIAKACVLIQELVNVQSAMALNSPMYPGMVA
ncbi:hypothetical protein L195_g061938, partial [Trifolium pratense]